MHVIAKSCFDLLSKLFYDYFATPWEVQAFDTLLNLWNLIIINIT